MMEKGELVLVDAGVWGIQVAIVTDEATELGDYRLVILYGEHSGAHGLWSSTDIIPVSGEGVAKLFLKV